MPYRIQPDETLGQGVPRIIREQIDKAVREIDDEQLDADAKVHQVRKRCKKIRGVLRLVREPLDESYHDENKAYRKLARRLAGPRDAAVMIQTYDAVMDHFADQVDRPRFSSVRRELTLRYKALLRDEADVGDRLIDARDALAEARVRIIDWPLEEDDGFSAAENGLKKTYKRARDAMEKAYDDPAPAAFHDWRKRVKYHGYHLRLLADAWRRGMDGPRKAASELSDLLGDDHDLTVLRGEVVDTPDRFGQAADTEAFVALLDERSQACRDAAGPLGQRLFAEKPKDFVRRMEAYWNARAAEPTG